MLETLGAIAAALFLLGLLVFCLRLAVYVFSGRYELDRRFNRYCE